jgi:iron complex outermembrane receptor protein
MRVAIVVICVLAAAAGAPAQTTQDLKRMSLEELLSITVTTVSREAEATTAVPAAVYVITGEDIRRSGATSLPEALRLAPGMQVARINAGTWSIGMRGFADRLARSMLVLIDGRAVYSPLFAGTYWEVQDTLVEDVERIEVIRGPGGTLWGANAVTGIINIITKPAANTTGAFAEAGAGTSDRALVGVRYGRQTGNGWSYRIYGKGFDRQPQFHADDSNFDGLRVAQGGFRADRSGPERMVTLQGDVYSARLGQRPTITMYTPPYGETVSLDAPLSGGHVQARWNETLRGGSRLQVQTFYARTNRDEIPVSENRDTFDVDVQHTLRRWRSNQITWGAGYRVTSGRITTVPPTAFVPLRRTDQLVAAFVYDDVTLVPNRWRLSVGSKFEHNDYSGFEAQPSGRLAWTPTTNQTAWWSVTRAVRTPSRVETDYMTTSLVSAGATPVFVRLRPNADFTSEELIAYEAGYRIRPVEPLYFTASAFYNAHDDVLSTEVLTPFVEPLPTPTRVVIPVTFANGLDGRSQGVELTGDFRPSTYWRVTANYSYLRIQMSRQPGSLDGSQERRNEGQSPRHQVQATSSTDIGERWSIDVFGRYVSELPAALIPAYWTTTARVAFDVSPQLEIAVVGHDLNDSHHVEWSGNIGIERSVYVKLTWRR